MRLVTRGDLDGLTSAVIITMKDGSTITDELAVANAHTLGATPWKRSDYIRKFRTLTEGILAHEEAERFLTVVQRLPVLRTEELAGLTVAVPKNALETGRPGLF